MKIAFILAAVCVAGLAYYLASQDPLLTPDQVSEGQALHAPAVAIVAPSIQPPAPAPAPAIQVRALPAQGQPRIEHADEQALVKHNIKFLENLRRIPDAGPLVDEIVEYLKNDSNEEFSVNNIPADKNGLSVVDEHTTEHMVGNQAMREKWTKLMELVAAHPEALRPPQNPE